MKSNYLLNDVNYIDPKKSKPRLTNIYFSKNSLGIPEVAIGNNKFKEFADGTKILNLGGSYVAPAFCDIRCSIGDVFKSEECADLDSAVKGGYGIICPTPEESRGFPDTVRSFSKYKERLDKFTQNIKILPIAPVMRTGYVSGNIGDISDFISDGTKLFTDRSPVGYIDNAAMKTIMMEIAKGDGLLICSTHDNKLCKDGIINAGEIAKHKDLAGIPKSAELISVMRNLFLAEETGCRIHISGISLGKSVEMIRNAKDNGVNVTCSVAPPYFSVNEREIFFREAMAKLMPPLRNPKDVAAIVQGLADNTIDCIESDHAPVTVTEKQDLKTASFGSASFETAFRAGVTHLVKHGKISIFRLIELMSVRPYEILFNKPFEEKDLVSMGMVRIDISSNTYFSKRNSFVSNRASIFDGALLHGNASRII